MMTVSGVKNSRVRREEEGDECAASHAKMIITVPGTMYDPVFALC